MNNKEVFLDWMLNNEKELQTRFIKLHEKAFAVFKANQTAKNQLQVREEFCASNAFIKFLHEEFRGVTADLTDEAYERARDRELNEGFRFTNTQREDSA